MVLSVPLNAEPYHVQRVATKLRNGFPYFDWHDSVSQFWEQLWREDCQKGIYPFGESSFTDMESAFTELIKQSGDNPSVFYDPDRFAQPFLPIAKNLVTAAEKAESEGRREDAKTLFLRAAAVFRISRFPMPRTDLGRSIWEQGKEAYARGARYLEPPPRSVDIPFVKCNVANGDTDTPIPGELWIPSGKKPVNGWPLILFIGGIDGYRIDVMVYARPQSEQGYAVLVLDCPGTGDNPAATNDPTAPERWMDSIIAWAKANTKNLDFDPSKILIRGVSMGGYYAMRAAHTNASDLYAVVAQGGCSHHVFDPAWIRAQNQMEFSYALVETLAWKFGFRGKDGIERYTAEGHKFSLVESGLLGKPTCPLLIINGMEDTLWPIEDCILVATSGTNISLMITAAQHMGDPEAEDIIGPWLARRVAETQ
ncbi:alpha/beta-hydrolase [Xylariaceae sp. FL0255]|nr:alpha/beta-hydrolase [Xylariaceae sp. FL0255]